MPTKETPVEKRIREITMLHGELMDYAKNSLPKAIRIGELLCKQKEELGHGNFMKWVKANVPFIRRSTANNYMKLHLERHKLPTLGNLKLNEAHQLLRHGPQKEPPEPKPLPKDKKGKEVTLTLDEEQEKEFSKLAGKLGEVFQTDNTQNLVLSAMQYCFKVLINAKDYPAFNGLQQSVAQATNGKIHHRSVRRNGNRRKAG